MQLDQTTFLHYREEFSLGHLTTESFHPLTINLSYYAQNDLTKALLILKKVDLEALNILETYSQSIYDLYLKCHEVLSRLRDVDGVGRL